MITRSVEVPELGTTTCHFEPKDNNGDPVPGEITWESNGAHLLTVAVTGPNDADITANDRAGEYHVIAKVAGVPALDITAIVPAGPIDPNQSVVTFS